MGHTSRSVLLAAWCFVLAGVLPAAAQNASLQGVVRDETGAALPGVAVVARNQETGLSREALSAENGAYRIAALPPGIYTLTAALQGFQALESRDVRLTIEQEAQFNFTLKVAAVQEAITVSATSTPIETSRSEVTTFVSDQQIQALPVNTRRWIDLALLVPGTSQDNIRGFFYRGNVNIGGGTREYSNAFQVDGVNNTWAEMGEARQNFAMDSIREFKVSTSNFKAEYGLATGGLLTVVSKSGTNELHGSGLLFMRDEKLNKRTRFEATKPDFSRYQYGGSLGGPIRRDRTHFFGAYERTDEDQFFTVNTGGIHPQFDGTFESAQFRYMYTLKLDHQVNDSQNLFARFAGEDEYRPILQSGGTVAPTGGFDFAVPRDSLVIGHTWVKSNRSLNDFRFQRGFSKYEVSEAYSHGSWEPGDFNPERLALCETRIIRPTLIVGNCNDQQGPETRWQFKNDFSYFLPDRAGSHQLKVGVDYNYVEFAADILGNFKGLFEFATDRPFDPNDRSTFPIRYQQSEPRFGDLPVHHLSVYFQDDWQPKAGLTFNVGLRYDLQTGVFNEDIRDIQFPMTIPFHEGADRRGDRNNFGPRVGFAWDPGNEGRTNIHAAYGLYYDNIRTLLSILNERVWHQAQTIIIANPSFPDPLQGRSRTEFLSTAPPNIEVMSNDFVNPYAHQYNIGIAQMIGQSLSLTVDFTATERYSDRDIVNINYPVNGVRPFPQFGRVDEVVSDQDNRYRGLLVKAEKRFSAGYQFLASYTLSKADDDIYIATDTTRPGFNKVTAPSAADRRHRFTLSGIVQLPAEFQVSAILDLRSNLPFVVHSGTDLNRDTYSNDLIPGVAHRSGSRGLNIDAVNAYRASLGLPAVSESGIENPTFANVDVRLARSFRVGRGHRVEGIFQVFNIFNQDNTDFPVGNARSALFGRAIAFPLGLNAPARQIELAVRYSF